MIINLPNGRLSLAVLKDGELLLGALTQGSASVEEIRAGLKDVGVTHGHQKEFMAKLAGGHKGQLPIATSETRVDLVKFKVAFSDEVDTDNSDPYEILAGLHKKEISGMVMEGDRLLSIISTSKRIMTKPDGTEIILSDAGQKEIEHFCGKNVRTNKKGNSIYATKDGVAQITTRGKVSVYPFESHQNINKIHGDIETEHAMLIQGDITGGAKISSMATLIVRGVIRASHIRCGGDLDCVSGLDNIRQTDEGRVRVEQNLRTSIIKNFDVWVGSKLFANRIIDHSEVEALDTLVCPRIADSKIAVGHRLITFGVVRDCVIKFGPGAVEDPFITKFKMTHLSRSRKHHDKHLGLEFQRAQLEQLRQKSLLVLQRLKTEGQSNAMVGNVLKRYITNMKESFRIYMNGYAELLEVEALVKQERAELAYHDSLIKSFSNPSLTIVGKMEAGTRIVGPVDSIKLQNPKSSVIVTLDPDTQKLVFSPLAKQGDREEDG